MTFAKPTAKPITLASAFLESLRTAGAPKAPERPPTLEEFITGADYCNFPRPAGDAASPAQLALIRAADGLPPGLDASAMRFHFACAVLNQCERPSLVIARCGVRAAKSAIAAMASLIYGAIYADMSGVRPGEHVRALVVAPKIELSMATFHHVVGTIQGSKRLSGYLDKDPLAERVIIKRPDGHKVEIRIVAAARGGANLRSTWLAGCVFDEADFHDQEDAMVNLDENLKAVAARMLPGTQVWVVSSPWVDSGPFHKLMADYHGTPKDGVLAFHSDSRSMNPKIDRRAEEQMRARDPDKAAREYDAIPLSSDGTEFFPIAAIRACAMRAEITIPPVPGVPHFAGADLGFRKNSSAIAIARHRAGKVVLVYHEELRPEVGKPLVPSEVCEKFAHRAHAYQCTTIRGDDIYAPTAWEEFPKHKNAKGDAMVYNDFHPSAESNAVEFTEFKRLMLEGLVELPNDPRLIMMLEKTKSKALPGGRMQIILPKMGHAHGDVLVAVVQACLQVPLLGGGEDDDWGTPVNDSRWGDGGRGFG